MSIGSRSVQAGRGQMSIRPRSVQVASRRTWTGLGSVQVEPGERSYGVGVTSIAAVAPQPAWTIGWMVVVGKQAPFVLQLADAVAVTV